MRTKIIHVVLMSCVCMAVLVVKAYWHLPIFQFFLVGSNLYRVVNEVQFIETAIVTFVIIFLGFLVFLKVRIVTSMVMALSFACLNFGLMIIDVASQTFSPKHEQLIRYFYGPRIMHYAISCVLLMVWLSAVTVYLRCAGTPSLCVRKSGDTVPR